MVPRVSGVVIEALFVTMPVVVLAAEVVLEEDTEQ